jgi:hypothetical protein
MAALAFIGHKLAGDLLAPRQLLYSPLDSAPFTDPFSDRSVRTSSEKQGVILDGKLLNFNWQRLGASPDCRVLGSCHDYRPQHCRAISSGIPTRAAK